MGDAFESDREEIPSSRSNTNSSAGNSSPSSSETDTSSSDVTELSVPEVELHQLTSAYVGRKRARRVEAWSKERELDDLGTFTPAHSESNSNHTISRPDKLPRFAETTNPDDQLSVGSSIPSFYNDCRSDEDGERIQIIRESAFGRCADKEGELLRLREILWILTRTVASRDDCNTLLSTDVVDARFSYHQLESYAKSRCGVEAFGVPMCPKSHMAQTGSFVHQERCMSPGCGQRFVASNKYWYSRLSEQLRALCLEEDSFWEILQGCRRAQRAVREERLSTTYDFYDGKLFREKFTQSMDAWDPNKELYIFLTLSSDGVQVFKGRDGDHSCWPVMFTILNLGNDQRFRAANALLSAFIPGNHDGDFFDTFLCPIVEDLEALQKGHPVVCADGRERLMKVFVLFCTADWPGATKLSGFAGHNSCRPCRFCLRRTDNRTLNPSGNSNMLRKALEGASLEWLNCECPLARTNQSILETWSQLDEMNGGDEIYSGRCDSRLTKATGIKRRPIISRLSFDFANAFPYDSMHLLLQGWVRLLIVLLCGMHSKAVSLQSPFILSQRKLQEINSALDVAAVGLPASWGRPPPRLDNFSAYKAETLKSFALFYACALFSGSATDATVVRLWVVTRDILLIAFDPTPALEDICQLQRLVQKAHALFTKAFKVDNHHHFCFTPTTHAILHLPEILEACGPLLNVSQFLAERVMGEVKKHVMSRVRPEANLFHKSQMLFGLKMLEGGISLSSRRKRTTQNETLEARPGFQEYASERSDEIREQGNDHAMSSLKCWQCLGIGKPVLSASTKSCLRNFICREYGMESVSLRSVLSYGRARKSEEGVTMEFETAETFIKRQKGGLGARQKCWVAAEFASEPGHSLASDIDDNTNDVYYGKVVGILKVEFNSLPESQDGSERRSAVVVEVEWQQGLSVDRYTGEVSTKLKGGRRRGTLGDTSKSVEPILCVRRSIAFFDYNGRRCFFDQLHSTTYQRAGKLLKGIVL